jgi:hypothetical protein
MLHHFQSAKFCKIVASPNQNLYPRFFHLCTVLQPCLSDLSIRVMTGNGKKLTASLVLQVFGDDNAYVVKIADFLGLESVSTDLQQLS